MRRFLLLFAFITSLFSTVGHAQDISAEALLQKPPGDILILDVRSAEEFAEGHVPGAINIPHSEVADNLDVLLEHKDKPIAYYCVSGYRAGKAAKVLKANGFEQLYHLDGDMKGWKAKQLPLAQ